MKLFQILQLSFSSLQHRDIPFKMKIYFLTREMCDEKSVKELQNEIAAKGINVSCENDPRFVIFSNLQIKINRILVLLDLGKSSDSLLLFLKISNLTSLHQNI